MGKSPGVSSSRDSALIYIEILRLEKERQILREKQAAATRTHYEKTVASTFFSKVMAKRNKARLSGAVAESTTSPEQEKPLLSNLLTQMTTTKPHPLQQSGNNNEPESVSGGGDRRNLEISLDIEGGGSKPIPHLCGYSLAAIPPEPVATPTIVCPKGFKGLKFVDTFSLKFTPAECCGGPRSLEIHAGTDADKCLCFGRIDCETQVYLQKQGDDGELEELLGMKFDSTTSEWTLSFPELETVAYMVRPKPASRVSAAQVYEIFSADGCSNYFNLGVEMEKKVRVGVVEPEFVFRVLNTNLATVATVVLRNFKEAEVVVDDSLWPSQKAVILAVALFMAWDVVQDIRRKSAWLRVFIVGGVVLVLLMGILLVNIYLLRREE